MGTTDIKHWRLGLAGQLKRVEASLCGLQDRPGAGVAFTSKPRLITCPTCKREKELRAALARARYAGMTA